MNSFIPAIHFKTQEQKLKPDWCDEVMQHYYYQTNLINLLQDKDVATIEGYASGDYDTDEFKKIFKSLRKQMAMAKDPNMPKATIDAMNKTGLSFDRVPLIPPKLNSAIAVTQKIPLEVKVTCTDPLAQKKKKKDLEFLKYKAELQAFMQEIDDSLALGPTDMGTTKYSSIPYTSMPYDLDPNDEMESTLFANMIYNLAPEAAFEILLNLLTDTKKIQMIKLQETRDQYKYAVSVNQSLRNKMTGLPDPAYVYPGSVMTDGSDLPDYGDNVIRVISKRITPLELFKLFPDEICSQDDLEEIVGRSTDVASWGGSYCACNNRSIGITRNEWKTFKMMLEYVEVKSVDYIMVGENKTKKKTYEYFTNDESKCKSKIWMENTYCFFWLRNTKKFFGITLLDSSYRKAGSEKYCNFSTTINKTQHKSAVELSIPENKKAQIADIKLQHNIIMSMPAGKVVDIKYLRNVIEGVKSGDALFTIDELLEMAMEKNIHIIDTSGYEGRMDQKFKAVDELPGGLKGEIEGYYRVILEADNKIAAYTNINNQLTGQSANPEGLVGMQKLLINSSINGLYYVNEALGWQYTGLYTLMANQIKSAIEHGGEVRKSIEAKIGNNKVEIIDAMDDIPLHEMGIVVKLGQREEERAQFQREVEMMRQEGKIDAAAKYYILNTPDPKDAMFLAAMFERKWQKRQEAMQRQQAEYQQQLVQQQGQNALANTQAQVEGDVVKINEKAKADAGLMQLGNQLGLTQKQMERISKLQLQDNRQNAQLNKSLQTQYLKSNLEQQQPIPA